MERENARTFVERLGRHMEALIGARGAVEVDVRLQEFASKFCEGTLYTFKGAVCGMLVRLDLTPEIEVSGLLFDRLLSVFTIPPLKQHIK